MASELKIKRTDREVYDLLNECLESIDFGKPRFKGQTYEEGIVEAIRWIIGESEDHPIRRSRGSDGNG